MKRPRSYGEDLDEDGGEKAGFFKDWARRDPDSDRSDRSDRSSHRRIYCKPDNGRKGSSSTSHGGRSIDEDRESSRSLRKRFDQDPDSLDRRKGGFDRSFQVSSSSTRVGFGSSRIRRSESFSFSRRDFPKGFRSERDRPRREGSGGSSWRRSVGGKDTADEEERSAAVDSNLGCGEKRVVVEGRGRIGFKDSSSTSIRDPISSRIVERKKPEEVRMESCSSSEMEEGELEPDLEPFFKPQASEDCREPEIESRVGLKESLQEKLPSSSEERLGKLGFCEKVHACVGKEVVDTASDPDKGINNVQNHHKDSMIGLDDKNIDGVEEEPAHTGEGGDGQETAGEEHPCSSSPGHDPKSSGKEAWLSEEERKSVSDSVSTSLEENLKQIQETGIDLEHEVEVEQRKERQSMDPELEQREGQGLDLEMEAEYAAVLDSGKEGTTKTGRDEVTLSFMTDKQKENGGDKGKSLVVVSLSNELKFKEEEDAMEGPSSRGFELVFRSEVASLEKVNCSVIESGKCKDEKLKLEPLDLSLGLPGAYLDDTSHDPQLKPNSPGHSRSIQSFPSSFRTNSDGFTASISFSGSQQFVHNPSCSLTQNSTENYENSVGSRPIFQGIDQVNNGTIWQGQPSNEPRRKGGAVPLYQRMLQNGSASHHSLHAANGHYHSQTHGPSPQSSFPRQVSPTHSHGSRETNSERIKDKKLLTRERSSSSSLFRREKREAEQIILNGVDVVERIVAKIVSEPVQVVGKTFQEMTEQSIAYLKETIGEMVVNGDKHGQLSSLQEALQRRSDLTLETLSKSPRVLLEILVTLKTGLPVFLRKTNTIPSSDLAEIFLDLKCRNLACRSSLPVDECDCKVCSKKIGFCSACMCLVCSKFDLASNTCSWVGCDVCLHWCHTDCGLRDSHIRNGRSVRGAPGATEMQFQCVACGHPSEMFGFVKEVFKTCAKDWKAETLAKELEYVRRIFLSSDDTRGKRLRDAVDELLVKLENKANLPEVISYIMAFMAESGSNSSSYPSTLSPKELPRKNTKGSKGMVGSSNEAIWLPSVSAERSPLVESSSNVLPSMNCELVGRRTGDIASLRNLEKKPVVDELESVVKFKQAEVKMYQERADDARREAEGLRRIAIAKNEKIEEEYTSRIAKLHMMEAEERRRQKLEELQVLGRAYREYFNMKMRMDTNIKDLMLKMEAAKRSLN